MTVFLNGIKTAVLLGLLMGLCLAIGSIWGYQGVVIGFVIGGAMTLISFFFSAQIALASVGAQPVTRTEAPELYDMTERLATRAGIPMPKLYYSPEQAPNAFATGRNPKNGVVCVTAGLMQMMTGRELEGVVAHEIAHIKHRDILISTIAAIMAGAISQIAYMMMWFGGGMSHDEEGNGGSPLGLVGALLMMILAPIAAALIQMAISRSREFAADARGSEIAGGPEGLISALRKLEVGNQRIPMNVNPAESHMFIMKPLIPGESIGELFRTHPLTEKRIAALIKLMNQPNPYAMA